MILRVIRTAAKGSAAKTKIASLTSFYRSALVTCSGLGKRNLAHEMGHSIPALFGFRSSRTHRVLQQAQERHHQWSFLALEYDASRTVLWEGTMDTTFPSQSQSWVGRILIFCSESLQIASNSVKLLPVAICVVLCRLLNLCVPVSSSVKA